MKGSLLILAVASALLALLAGCASAQDDANHALNYTNHTQPIINPATTAPGCTEDGQCNTNLCKDGKCVSCRIDADCATGYCEVGVCKARPLPQCTSDSQCESNLCENGKCIGCKVDGDCHGTNACAESKCVANNPTVTIENGSCTIRSLYGPSEQAKKMGWKYARYYDLQVSGSMTGPERTFVSLDFSPAVPGLERTFSCGAWATDPSYEKLMHDCLRPANSSETAQWSDTETNIFGEYVNLDPNLQITVHIKVSERPYGKTRDEKTLVVSCPAENR